MIGQRVKLARRAAGFTLRDLADRVGVSAMAISKYETGKLVPSSKVLLALSKALNVKTEYFLRTQRPALQELRFRKHPGLKDNVRKQIEARALEQVERFQEIAERFPNQPFDKFEIPIKLPKQISDYAELEKVAEDLRNAWNLGREPIPDLTDVLERNGIRVFQCAIGEASDSFSGLAARVDGIPVVVIAMEHPGDRQRFTLAHELGHLILDGVKLSGNLNIEKASDRFAGCFLVPAAAGINRLGENRASLEPRELWLLKQEYGLSMCGWLHRARDLGVISYNSYRDMWQLFAAQGWNLKEPFEELRKEKPKLLEQLVFHALAEDLVSESKAAELLSLPLFDFKKLRNMERASTRRQ